MAQSIILCAGEGTRLGGLTKDIPKPMIKFNGKPFLEYIVEDYKRQGINDFIIPIRHHHEKIISYFGNGDKFGVDITYDYNQVIDENGGSFKRALKYINDDYFFVHFGDVFFPLNYGKLLEKIKKYHKKALIVASFRNRELSNYEDKNDLIVDDKDFLIGYDRGNKSGIANMLHGGVLLLGKDILKMTFPDIFKLEEFLFPILIRDGEIKAFVTKEIPYDIGSIDKMERFKEYVTELSKNGNVGKV